MPLDLLTWKSYAKARFKTIDLEKASKSVNDNYFHPFGGDNTTHISVIDNQGNAVSLTYTLEYSFGSGMGSSKLGFIFNNEMGDFNPVSDLTTNDGLIGTSPNLIEPEKRMLSSMTPTIITKKNRPCLIIGSPGGRTIINTVFQTILNVIVFKMKIKQAIEANKRNEKIKNFFINNKKKLILGISVLLVVIIGYFSLEEIKKRNKVKLADQFNLITINFETKEKQ